MMMHARSCPRPPVGGGAQARSGIEENALLHHAGPHDIEELWKGQSFQAVFRLTKTLRSPTWPGRSGHTHQPRCSFLLRRTPEAKRASLARRGAFERGHLTEPVPRAGSPAPGSIGWICQLAFVNRQTAAADALR